MSRILQMKEVSKQLIHLAKGGGEIIKVLKTFRYKLDR